MFYDIIKQSKNKKRNPCVRPVGASGVFCWKTVFYTQNKTYLLERWCTYTENLCARLVRASGGVYEMNNAYVCGTRCIYAKNLSVRPVGGLRRFFLQNKSRTTSPGVFMRT